MQFIFEFNAKTYPYSVTFVTICKSSIFDLFHQFLLLCETFMCSISATEKHSEVKFCTGVGLARRYDHVNVY